MWMGGLRPKKEIPGGSDITGKEHLRTVPIVTSLISIHITGALHCAAVRHIG